MLALAQPGIGGLACDGIAQRASEHVGRDVAFDEIVLCAAADEVQGGLLVLDVGHDHHRHIGTDRLDSTQIVDAAAVRQVEIEQNSVVSPRFQQFEAGIEAACVHAFYRWPARTRQGVLDQLGFDAV
ncbi:MAG TPA: hypothetical protein VLD39_00435, partial [Gammaproteobacteria bacterium]|nr:hypothetical protein [Gammaproteobacteria bacterium]